ncbi:hypothetical protein C9374_009752 [Naegleria lovaniensis]|uniref:Uncharacterized protein n=1 Tax=Naegleria lovaniensis TaxID=51637 RepID=A0AA88KXB8_NAELO|nr:uncharacterized protein C9374_009752 [Naegleria lovaniensis]KAG2393175.1 hypothetical protein C9374_009752 [Naegleria lovaniensis]
MPIDDSYLPCGYESGDDEIFLEVLNNSNITIVDGKIQEDSIQKCCPQALYSLPGTVWEEISMEVKMKIYLQLFLKDAKITHLTPTSAKQLLKMLYKLPEFIRITIKDG